MSNAAQKRAIKNYRRRLQKRGMVRFEVLGLDANRELIRSLAKKLAQDDPEAQRIRSEIKHAVFWAASEGWSSLICDLFRTLFHGLTSHYSLQRRAMEPA